LLTFLQIPEKLDVYKFIIAVDTMSSFQENSTHRETFIKFIDMGLSLYQEVLNITVLILQIQYYLVCYHTHLTNTVMFSTS
jgi:hypothetical protein